MNTRPSCGLPKPRPPSPSPPRRPSSSAASAPRNYDPLPVVLQRGDGVWLFDTDGRRYLDMMSAYSAVSFGHAHPALVPRSSSRPSASR